MAAETLDNLIHAITVADGMLSTASAEDALLIQADIASMVARIKVLFPGFKVTNHSHNVFALQPFLSVDLKISTRTFKL